MEEQAAPTADEPQKGAVEERGIKSTTLLIITIVVMVMIVSMLFEVFREASLWECVAMILAVPAIGFAAWDLGIETRAATGNAKVVRRIISIVVPAVMASLVVYGAHHLIGMQVDESNPLATTPFEYSMIAGLFGGMVGMVWTVDHDAAVLIKIKEAKKKYK